MADLLAEYLSRAMTREWRWGELDCFLFCADWVKARTGADPAGKFRGAYDDQRAARRLMKASGGIVALADSCMNGCGFARTLDPIAEDVGLVLVPLMQRGRRIVSVPVGAICLKPRMWAIKTKVRGEMVARDFPMIAAWALKPQYWHADA